jgi:hypothetical protein
MSWFNRLMLSDAGIKMAAREFAGGIASRVREFEGFVPSGSDPVLASMFLEAQVRSCIEDSELTSSCTRSGAPFLFCSRGRVEGKRMAQTRGSFPTLGSHY